MDPQELASEPPWSRIGAASNSAPELRVLGWVMLSVIALVQYDFPATTSHIRSYDPSHYYVLSF